MLKRRRTHSLGTLPTRAHSRRWTLDGRARHPVYCGCQLNVEVWSSSLQPPTLFGQRSEEVAIHTSSQLLSSVGKSPQSYFCKQGGAGRTREATGLEYCALEENLIRKLARLSAPPNRECCCGGCVNLAALFSLTLLTLSTLQRLTYRGTVYLPQRRLATRSRSWTDARTAASEPGPCRKQFSTGKDCQVSRPMELSWPPTQRAKPGRMHGTVNHGTGRLLLFYLFTDCSLPSHELIPTWATGTPDGLSGVPGT